MTDWQGLISGAAAQAFARTGRLLSFRLARGDMIELAASLSGMRAGDIWASLRDGAGIIAMRCLVWCGPLDRHVIVDEWLGLPSTDAVIPAQPITPLAR